MRQDKNYWEFQADKFAKERDNTVLNIAILISILLPTLLIGGIYFLSQIKNPAEAVVIESSKEKDPWLEDKLKLAGIPYSDEYLDKDNKDNKSKENQENAISINKDSNNSNAAISSSLLHKYHSELDKINNTYKIDDTNK